MHVEAVVKFGGSLERLSQFLEICSNLGKSLQGHKAIIVPGGGRFADEVRSCDRQWDLTALTSHWMAILAMEQFGYMLAEKIPHSTVTYGERDTLKAWTSGNLPVFLPYGWLRAQRSIPESWDITSDSLSCYIAAAFDASRLILLKDAMPEGCTKDLLGTTWVDPMFTRFLSRYDGEAWLCDGKERLSLNKTVTCGGRRCFRLK
jgi:hypothetical protein